MMTCRLSSTCALPMSVWGGLREGEEEGKRDNQVSRIILSIYQLSYQDCTQNDNPFIHTVTQADNANNTRRTPKSRDPGGDFGVWERGG